MALVYAAQLSVGVAFVASGVGKLLSPGGFQDSFVQYTGLPRRLSTVAGPLEIVLGLWTAVVPVALTAILPALVVLFSLTAVLVRAHRRGVTQPCNCFGGLVARFDWSFRLAVGRNCFLGLLALSALFRHGDFSNALGFEGVAVSIVLAGLVTVIIIALPALTWLVSPSTPAIEDRGR